MEKQTALGKSLTIIIDLHSNILAELQALRTVIVEDYIEHEGKEYEFNDRYSRLLKENREAILAQIVANYAMKTDVDDILKGLFDDTKDDPEDKL